MLAGLVKQHNSCNCHLSNNIWQRIFCRSDNFNKRKFIPSTCKDTLSYTDNTEMSEGSLKSGHIEVGASTELSLSLDSHLKNKVVEKPGITFEDQSIEIKLQCIHVKGHGKVLKIWMNIKAMAFSIIWASGRSFYSWSDSRFFFPWINHTGRTTIRTKMRIVT